MTRIIVSIIILAVIVEVVSANNKKLGVGLVVLLLVAIAIFKPETLYQLNSLLRKVGNANE